MMATADFVNGDLLTTFEVIYLLTRLKMTVVDELSRSVSANLAEG